MLGEMDKSYQSKFLRHLYNAQMKLENKFAIQPDTLSFLSYVSLDLELGPPLGRGHGIVAKAISSALR